MSLTPDNWVETTFCDVTSYISRGKSPKYAEVSKLPVVNQRAIRWHGIQNEYLKYIHPDQIEQWTSERFIQEGDVLWNSTGTGTIGRACLVQKAHLSPPKVVDSHVTIIRPNKEVIDPRYLFAWIRSPEIQKSIVDLSSGSTNQIELNRSTIAEIHLPLAPLNEQRRIADKLDVLLARVDACRDRLDRVPKILKRFHQSVLAAATSGALTKEWRADQGEKFEWEKVRIDDLLVEKPRNGYSPKAVAFKTNTRSLTLSATTSGRFNPVHSKYIDEDIPKNSYLWLMPGDILIQRANTIEYVGVSAIYDGPIESFIYPDLMMKCRPNHRVLTEYLYYILSSEPVRNYFRENATGTAGNMPKINQQTVLSAPALVPKLSEQRELVRRVEILFAFANRLEASYAAGLEQVAQLTPSLLDKAFRGELVPQDPNDEPASKLLKRIKEGKANEPEQKRESWTNKIKKERHLKTKAVTTLDEFVSVLDQLGGDAMADRLVIESGLTDDIDRFFELLREGKNTILDVPVGSNKPIRRIVDANQ